MEFKNRITIFSGHFGSGKTELAINTALKERAQYEKVAINDLDVINPYFRSRDVENVFQETEIELIAPKNQLAASDLPIVSGEIYRVIHDRRYRVIIDAGGDKDGATVLGQYYHEWKELSPELLFVLNANRPYVSSLEGAIDTIKRIEQAARIKVTGIINNTNIGHETSMEDIRKGYELSKRVSERLKIPIAGTTISCNLQKEAVDFVAKHKSMFIKRYMKLPWEG